LNLLHRLIDQAKNPTGFVGSLMLKIMNTAHYKMNKWALAEIVIPESAIMLDVGCGGGKTLQLLSNLNTYGKIYGIDYAEQAVKDSMEANKLDIEMGKMFIQQACVTKMPFSTSTFDLITAFQTHYFWSDIESSIEEIYRVLASQGCFLLVAELYKINYHMAVYKTKEEMEQLFHDIGFNTVNYVVSPNQKWICIKGFK
jgi:ubiquinone/menaquinone biosynthesis C-methylase UbiE